jgi:Type IV secretion-system coupling protein DNA-binding domain
MFAWLFGSWMGWLFRKQIGVAARVTMAGIAASSRMNSSSRAAKLYRSQEAENAESERLAGCREVVLQYAQALGFIAREVISRDELEKLIDRGISPDNLSWEIQKRIDRYPGIMLGHMQPPNGRIAIKLPHSLRDRHMYIIGKSGSGKTNLIRLMALQDIHDGHGIGMLAPEQELLMEEILPYIPEDRVDDVVYFNPANSQNPIPLNPLYLDADSDIDLCVDDNMTVFKRLMGETHPRMEEILRQSLYALMERPNSTLLDVEKLLSRTDDKLRNEVIRKTSDEQTRYFFESTYPSFPKDAHLPITTRINRLTRPRSVRSILCQPGKSFHFREAMDEGKILLFNLADGILGEQTAQLLGQLVISKLQLATMSRMDTPAAHRRPFYLYLDEFQTFVGVAENSYATMLSRSRKYKCSMILSHQQTGQLSKNLLADIFGNVTTFISFSVAYADAQRLSQQYIVNMGAQKKPLPPEEFVSQKVGEAIGKIGESVFALRTPLVPKQPNPRIAEYIINRSAQNYGLHANRQDSSSRTTWEARVEETKLLPPQKQSRDINPERIF